MSVPSECRYTKDHEWVRVEGASAVIGITEFAQSELGDLVFVDLPAPGKSVKAGDVLCVVESTKAASDVYSPLGGVVQDVNSSLTDAPELVNKSPYADGWLARLQGINEAEIAKLMTAEQYQELLSGK